jgi:hypothetical protein
MSVDHLPCSFCVLPAAIRVSARGCARKSATLSHALSMVHGMGRPRTCEEARIATAVRLPLSVHRRLQAAAADRDVSANLLVTRAVCEYLDRLPSLSATLGDPEAAVGGEPR